MAMKPIMRRKAAHDIRGIAIYTEGKWGREQRKKYMNGLSACIDGLVARPASGLSRDEIHPGLKSKLYGEHIVFFLPTPKGVAIIRVLHQSMDVSRRLNPEEIDDTQ
jgi:toxin ParE1/3/4